MRPSRLKLIPSAALCLWMFAWTGSCPARATPGAREGYPEFSWETVPLYQMFGHDTRLLTDAEVRKIAASSDFICIEKQHGCATLGGAELGAYHEARRFKAVKPGIKVLFYWNAAVAYPFTTFTREFAVPTGGFARFAKGRSLSAERREWLVVDPKTQAPATRDGHTYFFDVLNADFRKWWSDTAGKAVRGSECDGFFLDQLHGAVWLRPGKRGEIRARMRQMMRMAKTAIGNGRLLLANNGARDYLDIADAFMFEHYDDKMVSKEAILEDWVLMKKISEAGKISVYRMQPDLRGTEFENASRRDKIEYRQREIGEKSKQLIEFPLACFLVGAQPYSYFCYNWGWGLDTGPLVDYAEFKKPLGRPKGGRIRKHPDKWIFTREFEHASVWLDLENQEARIDWHAAETE